MKVNTRKQMKVTFEKGVVKETPYLYYGDLNGVYTIDAGDITEMGGLYGTVVPQDKVYADYDDSGEFGMSDLSCLIINVGFSYSELDG